MAYWPHWLVSSLNWVVCLIKTVKLVANLGTAIMSHSSWLLPQFLLTLCLEYNSRTPLNLDLCFALLWLELEGPGSFSFQEPRMKRSQWCWGVTGERGLVVRALDQRSCWPVCPGPEKASYRGHLHLPSQKKQVVYESGTCDMSHLIPCNFLSFEIFDWIQFQRDHCRPLVHESPLGVRRQPVVRLDSINYHLWGQKCSSSVNFPPFSSFVIKG